VANLQPQWSIRDTRSLAHMALIDRLRLLDLSPLLVYRIDSVPDSALPALAWQFDLINPLWGLLAGTSASQRDTIKNFAPLHQLKGTVAALKTGLANLGYPNCTILEGQASWGGTSWPSSQGWAVVRIVIPVPVCVEGPDTPPWDQTVAYHGGNIVTYNNNFFRALISPNPGTVPQFTSMDQIVDIDLIENMDTLVQYPWWLETPGALCTPTSEEVDRIIALFNFAKPERCWLDTIVFQFPAIADQLLPTPSDVQGSFDYLLPIPSDVFTWVAQPQTDPLTFVPQHNRTYQHAGFTYADQPIGPTDGATTLNGIPIEGNP